MISEMQQAELSESLAKMRHRNSMNLRKVTSDPGPLRVEFLDADHDGFDLPGFSQ